MRFLQEKEEPPPMQKTEEADFIKLFCSGFTDFFE
jgi:hypothetical protein